MGLQEPGDVGEVLLPLAGPSCGILSCPHLPLKDVLDSSNRENEAQDLAP
jgi:hypothetical protein